MSFKTINPATEEIIGEYELMDEDKVISIAKQSDSVFQQWKSIDVSVRASYFKRLAGVLRNKKDHYAKIMTVEMGKPIRQSLAEVEKCASTAEVYADKGPKWLEDEIVEEAFCRLRASWNNSFNNAVELSVLAGIQVWNPNITGRKCVCFEAFQFSSAVRNGD